MFSNYTIRKKAAVLSKQGRTHEEIYAQLKSEFADREEALIKVLEGLATTRQRKRFQIWAYLSAALIPASVYGKWGLLQMIAGDDDQVMSGIFTAVIVLLMVAECICGWGILGFRRWAFGFERFIAGMGALVIIKSLRNVDLEVPALLFGGASLVILAICALLEPRIGCESSMRSDLEPIETGGYRQVMHRVWIENE